MGYFDPISQSNPFLHFWSLSVEEQFYIFWPVLVIFFLKRSLAVYAGFLTLSLIFSYLVFTRDQNAMFYLMPTRIFQFAAGALIACLQLNRSTEFLNKGWPAAGLMIAGIGGILASAFMADGHDYDFSIAAVLPIAAALLILLSIHAPISHAVLGNRLFTWLGKRAYSLYLVHWPVIIFASYYLGVNRGAGVNFLIGLASVLLAILLYNFVEQPFRITRKDKNQGRKFTYIMVSFALSLCIGFGVYFNKENLIASLSKQAPSTSTASSEIKNADDQVFLGLDINALIKDGNADRWRRGRIQRGCHLGSEKSFDTYNIESCLPTSPDGPKLMIIADSFGAETIPMLETWIHPEKIISASGGGCLPFYPEPKTSNRTEGCIDFNMFRFEELERRNDITAVVMTTNWQHWQTKSIEETIAHITGLGKTLFIIGARPTYSENVAELLASPRGPSLYKDLSRYHRYDVRQKNEVIRAIVDQTEGAHFLDVLPYFCTEKCPGIFDQDKLIYLDPAHISPLFAEHIAKNLSKDSPETIALMKSIVPQSSTAEPISEKQILALRLECDAINENLPAATRRFKSELIGETFFVKVGDSSKARYEYWKGEIDSDKSLSIKGEYIEGLGGLKTVQMNGSFANTGQIAAGQRGVRNCQLYID